MSRNSCYKIFNDWQLKLYFNIFYSNHNIQSISNELGIYEERKDIYLILMI